MAYLGTNVDLPLNSGADSPGVLGWGLAFQACLVAMAVLLVFFWIELTVVTTLCYAAPLAAVSFFVGHSALRALSTARSRASTGM